MQQSKIDDNISLVHGNKFIEDIRYLLNRYVSFGLATYEMVSNLIVNHKVYTYTYGDKIVGVLTLFNNDSHIELKHIVVLPEYRDRGIATSLVTYALYDCNNKDNKKLIKSVLWVKPTGADAEHVLLRLGFKLVSHDLDYWSKDCTSTEFCPYRTGKCNCSCKHVEYSK